VGHTASSLHPPPIPTGVVQTRFVEPVADAEQTRLSAHSNPVQAWPREACATQTPHAPSLVAVHRPLAHCHPVVQKRPSAMVPPCGQHAGALVWLRKLAQFIAPSAAPHRRINAGEFPVCGSPSNRSQSAAHVCAQSAALAKP
jgi:hypothetical protein